VKVDSPQIVTAEGLRVFVPAADLPKSEPADQDGIVRLRELLLILPDGQESGVVPLPNHRRAHPALASLYRRRSISICNRARPGFHPLYPGTYLALPWYHPGPTLVP
jgi:hypothetical protein